MNSTKWQGLNGWRKWLLPGMCAVLLVLAFSQAAVAYRTFAGPWIQEIINLKGEPAWKRAGNLSQWLGPERTEYIGYLRSTIPEDAIVLVPTEDSPIGIFRFRPMMQYYLYPRELVSCPRDQIRQCQNPISAEHLADIYILSIDKYPLPGQVPAGYSLQLFAKDRGVYVPDR